jgi:DNA gyrase subunit A
MTLPRPDLSQADPAIRAYVESLEAEIELLRASASEGEETATAPEAAEPSEPPTSINVIVLSRGGLLKRTPRHLYDRQRRSGMGIFDIDLPDDDAPLSLTLADESDTLILLTNQARAFRLPVNTLPESPVRARGGSLAGHLPDLQADEGIVVALPAQSQGYLAMLSRSGHVRCLPAHVFGESLSPGADVYNLDRLGPLVAACWTPGNGDLFIATHNGLAIRFSEKQVSIQGGPGIRLEAGDTTVAIASVRDESGVFLLGADGKGTIRLMSGFNPNKSPGAGGKVAMKTGHLVGAVTVNETDDVFIISRLSKIIRFRAKEVPAKEGVVQGVHCMSLRADETVAVAASPTTPA